MNVYDRKFIFIAISILIANELILQIIVFFVSAHKLFDFSQLDILAAPSRETFVQGTHFLSIIGIFKNEADVMKEWLGHHVSQGVDHFYLVNNGSTDDFMKVLAPFIAAKIVTLVNDTRKHSQTQFMIEFTYRYQNETTWFMHIDLDEFLYVRPQHGRGNTIASALKNITSDLKKNGKELAAIITPWTVFGSSGHTTQPDSVRKGFTKCKLRPKLDTKYIVRAAFLEVGEFYHHFPILEKNNRGEVLDACGQKWDDMVYQYRDKMEPEKRCNFESQFFVLNHYRIMSLDRFKKVKMNRGDVLLAKHENDRDNLEYFYDIDKRFGLNNCPELKKMVEKEEKK